MPILNSYAKLREALFLVGKNLGIEYSTEGERKVLAVLASLSGGTHNNVSLGDIRKDVIVKNIPAPSLYRTFGTLQKRGYIGRSGGQRSRLYHLREQALY